MKAHKHRCRCGSVLVCPFPAELCPVKNWDCPACEQRALDAYMSAQADAERSGSDEPQQPHR